MALSPEDPHSYARPDLAFVTDIHLELKVNFQEQILKGKAVLTIERKPSISEIILDSHKLFIWSVKSLHPATNLTYEIGHESRFGSKFTINLPEPIHETDTRYKIEIEYQTSKNSPALHWLTSYQTANRTHPFIHQIFVPSGFVVLMSALLENILSYSTRENLFEYFQTIQVPSYAVAIAVGSLKIIHISEDIAVFTEPKYIQEIGKSFYKVERMIQVAKQLCGPYRWGRFDICVLPPCIGEFQIECPCVAFVSPFLLSGDLSIISPIARNISQSWAGLLVTCANYEHMWLNESFAIFIYRKIVCILLGEEMKLFLEMKSRHKIKRKISMLRSMERVKNLVPTLTDMLPENETKYVFYEIGYALLEHIQSVLGGSEIFEPFLKSYLDKFTFKSIKTDDWKKYLYEYFSDKTELLNNIDWDMWFSKISILQDILNKTYNIEFEKKCFDLVDKFINWDEKSENLLRLALSSDITQLNDLQKTIFLAKLYASPSVLSSEKLTYMSYLYHFDNHCYKIRYVWILLGIKSRWNNLDVNRLLEFTIDCCTPKFICALYQDLYKWEEMRNIATL
ncbi:leukotriene A-4 hydrolase-like, partial [Pogonomyrmex barbatus]|uniref:Leukotriene A-4 hydrolase-like n=1 Tax=Pogonomyrmex barbatus TaxID=144034 RepID=A0A6I9WYB5_9HYME